MNCLACPAGVEPATYGREGLANLPNTMLDKDIHCPNLGVRQNMGRRGVGWGLILRAWYPQAFVGKTDKFERPFKGRSGYLAVASLGVQSGTHSPLR